MDTSSVGATAICTYRVQQGKEQAFRDLLARHWPTLRRLGLVTEARPQIFQGLDEAGKPFFVEILTWRDGERSPATAEQTPEVMAIWEPMGALVEPRLGRPGMEFPHADPVEIEFAQV